MNIKIDELWKSVIRPHREEYSIKDLGPNDFILYGKKFTRKDYRIIGNQGNILQCSFYENEECIENNESLPVIIYCHGNSSSQKEIKHYLDKILKVNINVFAFDFSGCGKSEGEYISLGYYEKLDLRIVVDFVYKLPNVSAIGLWGHSMGAATILMYALSDPRIQCVCSDSAFSDLSTLLKEIAHNQVNLPEFIHSKAYEYTKKSVISKINVNIDNIKPINNIIKLGIPIYFIHSLNDKLINSNHTKNLYKSCGSFFKYITICDEGGHNSIRPDNIINEILNFFKKYLGNRIKI